MCTTGIAASPSGAALRNGVLVPSHHPLPTGFAPRAACGDNRSHSHAGSSRCWGWHTAHRHCPSPSLAGVISAISPCLPPPFLMAGCEEAPLVAFGFSCFDFPSVSSTDSLGTSFHRIPTSSSLSPVSPSLPRALREAVARGGEAWCPGTPVPGANPASRSPGAAQGCGSPQAGWGGCALLPPAGARGTWPQVTMTDLSSLASAGGGGAGASTAGYKGPQPGLVQGVSICGAALG